MFKTWLSVVGVTPRYNKLLSSCLFSDHLVLIFYKYPSEHHKQEHVQWGLEGDPVLLEQEDIDEHEDGHDGDPDVDEDRDGPEEPSYTCAQSTSLLVLGSHEATFLVLSLWAPPSDVGHVISPSSHSVDTSLECFQAVKTSVNSCLSSFLSPGNCSESVWSCSMVTSRRMVLVSQLCPFLSF